MKFFVFLLLVGVVSATLLESLEKETKSTITAFANGLQSASPLHIALGVEDSEDVQRLERDIKEELKKHIKEAFEKTLKKIEDAIANNKQVNEKALKMLKDLKEKMIDLNIEDKEVTEELAVLKSKVDGYLKQILEKMGIFDKRSTEPEIPEILESVLGDMSIKDMFYKLKKMILEKLDVPTLKGALIKIVGQASKKLCEWVTSKGQEKILNFFDRILSTDSETKKRASEDRLQEIKDYLENIEENIDDKLSKFKNWLHDLIGKGFDEAKEKVEKVTKILKEMVLEGKKISKKGLADILEYLQQYEDKFGSLYDLRNAIQKLLNKED